jgi:cytochrome c peroxidase
VTVAWQGAQAGDLAATSAFVHSAAMPLRLFLALLCSVLIAHGAAAQRGSQAPTALSRAVVYRQAEALTALGRKLFIDPALSASGKLSCASCHSPAHEFGPPDDRPVPLGGIDMTAPGLRAVPSLKYLQAVPQFTEHFFESEDDGDESVDNGPTGGLTWDGRADRGAAQALLPLLSPFEMANRDRAAVAARIRKAGYGTALSRIYGRAALKSDGAILAAALNAFEAFEQDSATFYPYSSKYDAYLGDKAELTPQEARGLALFNDPAKGNCAQCHISKRGNDGTPPQFTDYGLIAIGVPRNPAIPANADPAYHDLGLCGPLRTDLAAHPEYCGLFKTPSLRNVATRQTFFHNGVFHTLRQVMEFYVERDTDPGKWYARNPDGSVDKFDDLPAQYRDNINIDPPFDRHPGDKPALDNAGIDDVIAFLQTLTDGYSQAK